MPRKAAFFQKYYCYVPNHPDDFQISAVGARILGPRSHRPFPACLLLLAQFAGQPPGIKWGMYRNNTEFNRANQLSWKRLDACKLAAAKCRELDVTNDDLIAASQDRAIALKLHDGGDHSLTYTPRQGQDYRVVAVQIMVAACKLVLHRQRLERKV
jgi:hypothetical protein